MDHAGGVGIGHGYDINEPVERGGDPGPHWTAIVGAERIAEDFKLAPVVAFDEPRDQVGTRIFTELPGHVADADPLAAAGFGIVLHNPELSALAAGLLILSLARPAPAAE